MAKVMERCPMTDELAVRAERPASDFLPRAEIEVNGIASRMQRMGWGRRTWKDLVDDEEVWKRVGEMTAQSARVLKAEGMVEPVEEMYRVVLARQPSPPKTGPEVLYAFGCCLAYFHLWIWGFKSFGGLASGTTPVSEQGIYAQDHGLDTPGKWRRHCAELLRKYGLLQ